MKQRDVQKLTPCKLANMSKKYFISACPSYANNITVQHVDNLNNKRKTKQLKLFQVIMLIFYNLHTVV